MSLSNHPNRRSLWSCLSCGLAAFALLSSAVLAEDKPAEKVTYDDHVKAIFRDKCASCHNTDKKTGGLDLTSYTATMQGGSSGVVIEPGDASASYLYGLVAHTSEPFMPPNQEKLPDDVLAVIAKWIDGGALENAGSKPVASKKPKFNLALQSAPTGRPEGDPPMPGKLLLEPVVTTSLRGAVTALATSPWAPLAAVAGQKQVLLYNTKTLELLGVLPFPEGTPQVLKFSRTGSLLLVGGGRGAYRGVVVLFDIKTGERVAEVGDELDTVLAADISADQTLVAIGGTAKIVRVYSIADGQLVYEVKKHTEWIYNVAFSPDNVLLATADRNGGLIVWEAPNGREFLVLGGHGAAVNGLSWRSDSNILASCSEDTSIRLWEMENGGLVKNWGAHSGGCSSVEFTMDGRIASCGRDRLTQLWNQDGGQIKAFDAFNDLALQVTFCDESNRIISGDWTGTIRVWDAAEGKLVGELDSNPQPIAQRITAATTALEARNAEQVALVAAADAAQAAATKIQAELDAANKAVTDNQTLLDTAKTKVAEQQTAVEKSTAEKLTADKTVTDLEAELVTLNDALTKAKADAANDANNADLAKAAEEAQKQVDAKAAAIVEAKKVVETKATELKTAQDQLAVHQKEVETYTANVDTATKQVATLTESLKPAAEQAATAKTAADTGAQAVNAAQAELQRWQDALAFAEQLKTQANAAAGTDNQTAETK
ncbi:MAG: c-type cytochrome domain-containing protein [Planctomycetaceae bacterium]